MCFSPQADLIAGVVVGACGVDAMRHVRQPRQLPLAALPLLFAAHQFGEAFIWFGLDGRVSVGVGRAALYAYLVLAFLLPVLVPVAVAGVEPDRARRRWMQAFVGLGAIVAAILITSIVRSPIGAQIEHLHLSYQVDVDRGLLVVGLYVVATCGPMLVSTYRTLVAFGVLNLFAVALLAWLISSGFVSLWCTWAAVTSVLIARYLREAASPAEPRPGPAPSRRIRWDLMVGEARRPTVRRHHGEARLPHDDRHSLERDPACRLPRGVRSAVQHRSGPVLRLDLEAQPHRTGRGARAGLRGALPPRRRPRARPSLRRDDRRRYRQVRALRLERRARGRARPRRRRRVPGRGDAADRPR